VARRRGVVAEVEGAPAELDRFVESLRSEAPPLERIEEMLVAEIDPLGERNFAIRESQAQEGEFVLVSPEVATCPELARRNMTIPGNRRSLTLPIHLDRLQNFQS